jgi:hypothetical protein
MAINFIATIVTEVFTKSALIFQFFYTSRDSVTIDGVKIGNWIYWTLTDRNYK